MKSKMPPLQVAAEEKDQAKPGLFWLLLLLLQEGTSWAPLGDHSNYW